MAWYAAHDPFVIVSMYLHAFEFTGVSPQKTPCIACTFGCEMYVHHM